MRKLTIRRRKSFIGCLGKVKIYIEDVNGDTEICGTKCRYLGKIKNNDSATFEIDNASCKIFAIYGKVLKSFCNDFYNLPAGEDDLEISGVATFSTTMGNPFLFDGVDTEALDNRENNRRKSKVVMIPVIVVCAILGAVLGYYLASLLY